MNIPGRRISEAEVVITDPFPRGGDGLFLRGQLIANGGTTGNTLVDVFTRNREDDWPASALATLTIGTAVGNVYEKVITPGGIKEELRLKIRGAANGWAVIRLFPPVFYDAALSTLT